MYINIQVSKDLFLIYERRNVMAYGALLAAETGTILNSIVTVEMVSGVLDEVIGLLPILIPTMIGFIGIRKGVSFLQGVLHRA